MEHVFRQWARILRLFSFMTVFVSELPAPVAFLVPSFISCGYLVVSYAAVLVTGDGAVMMM
jgi:hypothetical protein